LIIDNYSFLLVLIGDFLFMLFISTCFLPLHACFYMFCDRTLLLKCLTNLSIAIFQQMQKLIKMTLRVSVSTSFSFIFFVCYLLIAVNTFIFIVWFIFIIFKFQWRGRNVKVSLELRWQRLNLLCYMPMLPWFFFFIFSIQNDKNTAFSDCIVGLV